MSKFNDLAKIWDSNPARVKGAMTFVDKLKKFLPKDLSSYDVLDYGCGTGLVSFGFANDVKSILGLDNSSGMVDVYNQKAKQIGMNNIKSEIHDINTQDLQENKFDLIVTNMTMHHIKDTKGFIQKLSNSLRPNGYLCIADLKTEDGTFHGDNTGVEYFGFDINEIKSYFEEVKLKDINLDLLESINKPHKTYDVFYVMAKK